MIFSKVIYRILLPILFASGSTSYGAGLALCDIGADQVIALRDRLELKVDQAFFDGNEALVHFNLSGDLTCLQDLSLAVEIDQSAARSLVSRPLGGPVLFGRAEVAGGKVALRLTSDTGVIKKLAEYWIRHHSLYPFVKSAAFKFLGRYNVSFEVYYPLRLMALKSICALEPAHAMACDKYSGLNARAVPGCFQREQNVQDYLNAIEFSDPFILGRDPRVRVRGVDRNLCFYAESSATWTAVVASDILFAGRGANGPETIGHLAQLQIEARLSWH